MAGVPQAAAGWRRAYLTQSPVRDIAATDDGKVWAVGGDGTMLHYDGASWRSVESPTDGTLHAVAFAAADDGWAVGNAGTILRYQGGSWRLASAPTLRLRPGDVGGFSEGHATAVDELFDIALVDGGGWAVGQRFNTLSAQFEGLILRLSGDTWTEAAMPDTGPLYAIAFASAGQGWAVGKAGTVLRWDGIQWEVEDSRTNVDLHDVAIAGDDFWAVGESGFLVHWDQERFFVESRPYGTLTGVGFSAPDDGWAVGVEGTVLHYDGATWNRVDVPLSADLYGLFVGADGIPWVTGEGGLIGRVLPGGWQFATQPYVEVALTAIDMLDETTGWAVGARPFQPTEGVVFWQRANEFWTPRQADGVPPLFDIDVLTEEEAWAVGEDFQVDEPTEAGVVWHYTSGVWTSAGYPGVSALFAVEAVGPNDVWAAGQDGALVHYDGTHWERTAMPENVHLYGLHFRTPGDGWAVGERFEVDHEPPRYVAVVMHYDGDNWEETPVPRGPPRLLAVYALSETDAWAVGNLGAVLHYDGARWTVVQGQQDYHLLEVDFADPGDGWAVGTQGTILRYQDSAWSLVSSPTTRTLNGVVSRPHGEAWAVGSQGAFLYHPSGPWDVYLPLISR